MAALVSVEFADSGATFANANANEFYVQLLPVPDRLKHHVRHSVDLVGSCDVDWGEVLKLPRSAVAEHNRDDGLVLRTGLPYL